VPPAQDPEDGAVPTSPLLVVVFTAPGVVGPAFGSGSTIPVSDSAAGFAVLEEAAPMPADLTINNEQEWTLRS